MPKALVLTEGGSTGGFGQITRSASLAWAFKEKGIDSLICIHGDACVAPIVEGLDYKNINWILDWENFRETIKEVEFIIIDSYKAPLSIYKDISSLIEIAIFVDDTNRLDYPRGIVLNGAFGAEHSLYQIRPGVRYFLGSRYFPLRRELWDVPPREIKSFPESILITFGGNDERNMTPRVLKGVAEQFPNLEKLVLVGNGFRNVDEIRAVADSRTRMIMHPDGHSVVRNMLESDLAISAAGQTLYELMRVGVPTIAVQIIENQEGNVRGLSRAGAIEFAGYVEDERILEKISALMKKFQDKAMRQRVASFGKTLIDGDGSRRIAQAALMKDS